MCLLCGAKALIFCLANCLEDALDTPTPLKTEAHNLIDRLPDDASWDDLMYQIYVRQAIEAHLDELEELYWADEADREWEASGKKSRPAGQLWDELGV